MPVRLQGGQHVDEIALGVLRRAEQDREFVRSEWMSRQGNNAKVPRTTGQVGARRARRAGSIEAPFASIVMSVCSAFEQRAGVGYETWRCEKTDIQALKRSEAYGACRAAGPYGIDRQASRPAVQGIRRIILESF